MLAQWKERFFGKKRVYKVKDAEIAAEVGWHPKYLSAVLNEHRSPQGAEERLTAALDKIIARKTQSPPGDQSPTETHTF